MSDWIEIAEVKLAPAEVVISGVTIGPAMIAAGVDRLEALQAAGAPSAAIVEEIYYAMRQAAGDGRAIRNVTPR